jgi:glycerophosphoryl diester phosphodiesterase
MPPLLLGHRGARLASVPENTFAAFDLALTHGADGFEFDVRMAADSSLIICHDPKVLGAIVGRTEYAKIIEVCESQQHHRAATSRHAITPPVLPDVLARYSHAFLDIELKVAGLERLVAAALRENRPGAYLVSSFLPDVLQTINRLDASIPLGLIADSARALSIWPELPIAYVIPHWKLALPERIDAAHRAGKKVIVWTVNDPDKMRQLATAGVDGLVSDDTDLLVRTIRPAATRQQTS